MWSFFTLPSRQLGSLQWPLVCLFHSHSCSLRVTLFLSLHFAPVQITVPKCAIKLDLSIITVPECVVKLDLSTDLCLQTVGTALSSQEKEFSWWDRQMSVGDSLSFLTGSPNWGVLKLWHHIWKSQKFTSDQRKLLKASHQKNNKKNGRNGEKDEKMQRGFAFDKTDSNFILLLFVLYTSCWLIFCRKRMKRCKEGFLLTKWTATSYFYYLCYTPH